MKMFGINFQEVVSEKVLETAGKSFNEFNCMNYYEKINGDNNNYIYYRIKDLIKDSNIMYLCFAISFNQSDYYEAKPVLDDLNLRVKGFIYFADNAYNYVSVPDPMTTANHLSFKIYALYWQEPEAE